MGGSNSYRRLIVDKCPVPQLQHQQVPDPFVVVCAPSKVLVYHPLNCGSTKDAPLEHRTTKEKVADHLPKILAEPACKWDTEPPLRPTQHVIRHKRLNSTPKNMFPNTTP